MSFFSELKRRNVFRVGAAYLVISWLVVQIIDTLGPAFSIPDGFFRGVVILLAIGFPVALIAAWIFELTPTGLQTQAEADESGYKTPSGKLNAIVIGGLMLVIILMAVDNYVLDEPLPPTVSNDSDDPISQDEITQTATLEKSLAVLPFTNLSSDQEQEYFSDGLAEELLNQLAQVQDLLVAARTSSFYYKGRNEDMRTIGRQLGVNYILEGSVRRAGDTVRISTQLIKADDGFNLWSETYERSLDNIFAIQDEIATEVTRALSINLGAGEFDIPGATRNVAALDEFLQGLAENYDFTVDSLTRAIEHLEQAVTIDPGFARGWFLLGQIYGALNGMTGSGENADYPALRDEAYANATRLAPDMEYVILMNLQELMRQGLWINAEEEYKRRLAEIGSSNDVMNMGYGQFLANVGRVHEAIPYLQRAVRINPKNALAAAPLIGMLGVDDRFDEAEVFTQKWLENGGVVQSTILFVYWTDVLYQGDPALLRRKIDTFFSDPANHDRYLVPENIMNQILMLVETDDRELAMREARRILSERAINNFGLIHLRWVAQQHQDMELYQMTTNNFNNGGYRWSPMTADFRRTDAFKDAMREQGLVNYWRSTGNWGEYCRPLEGQDDFECF